MLLQWNTIVSCYSAEVSVKNFWSGLNVWVFRPHIINRKIIGVDVLETWEISLKHEINDTLENIIQIVNDFSGIEEIKQHLKQLFLSSNVISNNSITAELTPDFVLQFRNVLPRSVLFLPVLEILLIDKSNRKIIFIPSKIVGKQSVTAPFVYMFHFTESRKIELTTAASADDHNASVCWLKTKVFPKVIRWCSCTEPDHGLGKPSLNRVSLKNFADIYTNLKTKYGKKLVEIWPESTDPSKYVYEDIGIAAYLMALWEEEQKLLKLTAKQSFVDLGCGNGLLVHILASEGYPGIGIDVRKRDIWSLYGPETKLIEKTIIPSDSNLFPEYDWIIGNHSDELTPWIPVIAARSSLKMRVFLLPCCCFTFNGKFCRQNPQNTKYQSYLSFIEELCQAMGFNVYSDKLRIPSTKRVCFICPSRNYDSNSEAAIDLGRTNFINKHSKEIIEVKCESKNFKNANICDKANLDKNKVWAESFIPKEKKEAVRNCSALDPHFIASTVKIIMDTLLKEENFIEFSSELSWNRGGNMHMKDMATILDSDILSTLKNQYGGLQTLLRSHKNVFTVQKGFISLTIPSTDIPINKRKIKKNKKFRGNKQSVNFETKPCFFHLYHPQGCPLTDKCTFLHAEN